jgi:hypothetical protein
MEAEAVGSPQRSAGRLPGREPPVPPAQWPVRALARVVSALVGRNLSAEQLAQRAVGLGVARQPAAADDLHLTPRAASRLLLAGYRLPAQVERGEVPAMCRHLSQGRRVFLVARPDQPSNGAVRPAAFEAWLWPEDGPAGPQLLLAEPGEPQMSRHASQEALSRTWSAGAGLIVAARRWDDLAATGRAFFGGMRDVDGAYRWTTAGCDTDARGRILRF